MSIFNLISLLGGLAMFLYGMRMMGDGLKESSSGSLKKAMEKLTNTPIKAFLLGVVITAVIQSSNATIVITSGLVGAGIITLRQSLGLIVGANLGTTVTGQIIRLLDINSSGTSVLQFFKPSTLAPLALIAGIVLIMFLKFKSSDKIGRILVGFGILFSGLINMTDAVSSLTESGIVEKLFSGLGENPFIGCLVGLALAFVLQSASAAIGILQAFSTSGQLTFSAVYPVVLGIYLGVCVTTAVLCNIGARPNAKRVGTVNILFNMSKSVLIALLITIFHKVGLLDHLWTAPIYSGGIANANTIFNLVCAILLFPTLGLMEKASLRIIKDEPLPVRKFDAKVDALSPVFFSTPALAFARCHEVLQEMFKAARQNIDRAFGLVAVYDPAEMTALTGCEDDVDAMTDRTGNYLIQLSAHITDPEHLEIMNHYYVLSTEFERLGDHATNIADAAEALYNSGSPFSPTAMAELNVLRRLIDTVLDYSDKAFNDLDLTAARHIEPLEEVVDDMVNVLKAHHLERLRSGSCSITAGTEFLNLLSDVERISDICSNIGVATVSRLNPELKHQVHDYVSMLHSGRDESFNHEYKEAHDRYFNLLAEVEG